jgi:hypothetical protein
MQMIAASSSQSKSKDAPSLGSHRQAVPSSIAATFESLTPRAGEMHINCPMFSKSKRKVHPTMAHFENSGEPECV